MKKFQFTPAGTIIVQLPAGVEATCLQDTDGTMYVPMMQISGASAVATEAATEPAPAAKSKKTEVAPALKKVAAPVDEDDDEDEEDEDDAPAAATVRQYTAKDLKSIDDKEALLKILAGRRDPADTDGKNTAEKYRRLILLAQEEAGDDETEEEEAPAPKKAVKAGAAPVAKSKKAAAVVDEDDDDEEDDVAEDTQSVTSQIEEVLTSFDAQDITLKKAVVRIMKFATKKGANEAKVTKLLSAFEKDNDSDTEETAAAIAAEISDETPAKAAKPAAKPVVAAKAKKAAPVVEDEDDDDDDEESDDEEGEVVEIADLAKGDSIAVFWVKMDEWYTGKVASIKKGVVTVDYEDETSEILDAEAHTEIRRYA